jgi:hypothetical protein
VKAEIEALLWRNIEMKKQILMSMLVVATLTVLSTAVQAQSQLNWSGKIPFEFSAAGKTLAAGEYTVKLVNRASDRPALLLQNLETREAVIVQTMSDTKQITNVATLQFRRYGNHYFFGGVQLAGDSLSLKTIKSKSERAIWSEFAKNGESATTVALKSK